MNTIENIQNSLSNITHKHDSLSSEEIIIDLLNECVGYLEGNVKQYGKYDPNNEPFADLWGSKIDINLANAAELSRNVDHLKWVVKEIEKYFDQKSF